jgi:dolichyl-diphosphooligosaccharide--protein glycosyltransferase/undecaprenyl-diphosphooligosaccharide--protein glycosyltransferase
VKDLDKLKSISSPDDYTLSWWDYGYPIRYYSETKTLIDGGKHQNDNFIISTILQTSSPDLAVKLSRLAVETYVDPNCSVVANTLFNNGKENQLNPNDFLSELEDSDYILPKKTRDIYLYLPYRMLNIFPTVAVFGNLDLMTGKAKRDIEFYPLRRIKQEEEMIIFKNGIRFNIKTGEIEIRNKKSKIRNFIVTANDAKSNIKIQSTLYEINAKYSLIYLRSYNRFILMDTKTFNSTYVQMFMLGKYDKKLFELVVNSPYSKIYKLKF